MGWHWELTSATGELTAQAREAGSQPAEGFPSQAEAETWVGEVWRELLEAGVDAVILFEDGRRVYGPMSLHPAEG
ncbi:MAG: glycine/betaine/sarcosine/D-proline family reductase selenoprotein B [Candidatus Nanopelagicales bacterium]|jgi:hypothetical protein|nr:glycine/betaine/sarcosine/D-proline family reductase selenoprotein B [Candidatus Nanopelagicales bacterium]